MEARAPTRPSFPCNPDGLVAAMAWVEQAALQLRVAPADLVRVVVLLDELFANTLMHGGEDALASEVGLALHWEGDSLALTYSDAGRAFNPLEAVDRGDSQLAAGRPGGLGLRILRAFCANITYQRSQGRNVIIATISMTQRPHRSSTLPGD